MHFKSKNYVLHIKIIFYFKKYLYVENLHIFILDFQLICMNV